MTEEEKKKMLAGFRKEAVPVSQPDGEIENDWTEDEILEAAKRIMRRVGIEGKLSDPNT